MTALIIIGAVLLLIFILLASSLTVEFEYDSTFKYKVKYLCFTIKKDPLSPREQKKKRRKEEKAKKKAEKNKTKLKKKRDKLRKKNNKGQHTAAKTGAKPAQGHNVTGAKGNPARGQQAQSGSGEKKSAETVGKKQQFADKKAEKKPKPDLNIIISIVKKAKPHIKRIFKKIRFTKVYVDITVGGDDAAKTAISYGVHCAAVDGLAAFLDNTITFKKEKICIRADFDLEKTNYYASGTLKLRMSTLLHSIIWGLFAVMGELKALTEGDAEDNIPSQNKKAA